MPVLSGNWEQPKITQLTLQQCQVFNVSASDSVILKEWDRAVAPSLLHESFKKITEKNDISLVGFYFAKKDINKTTITNCYHHYVITERTY